MPKTGRDPRQKLTGSSKARVDLTKSPRAFAVSTAFGAFRTAFCSLKSTLVCRRALFAIALLLIPASVLFSAWNSPRVATAAPVNSQLNFQARLLTNTGALVPDGNYHIEFKLYKTSGSGASVQGTCVGGVTDDCVWMETRTTGNLVSVSNGYFSVNLGSVNNTLGALDWSQQYWLTMNIGGTSGPSWNGEMTPRIQLTTVPVAQNALGVNSGNTSTASTNSAATTVQSGNATGTTSNSGAVTLQSGTATGTSGGLTIATGNATTTSGNIAIDVGTGSTKGTISLGSANASAINIGGTTSGPTTIKAANSTSAFQIQNSSGAALFSMDTTNSILTLGSIVEAGGINTAMGGIGESQNLLLYSEQFNNAVWVSTGTVNVTADSTAGPDNYASLSAVQNAGDTLQATTSGAKKAQTYTTTTTGTYNFSVWLKTSSGTQNVDLRIDSTGTNAQTGTVKTVTATTTWQRFWVTQSITGPTITSVVSNIFPGTTAGTGTVIAYGAQLSQTSIPLVYSHTTGSTNGMKTGLVSNGAAVFNAGVATDVPITINIAPSQSANIIEVQDSTGLVKFSIDSNGNAKVDTTLQTRNATGSNASNDLNLRSGTSSSGTTGNVNVDAGTTSGTKGSINIGTINTNSGITIGASGTTSSIALVASTSIGLTGATNINTTGSASTVIGNASGGTITLQSANSTSAFQVQNAAGTSLFSIDTSNTRININADTESYGAYSSPYGGFGPSKGNLLRYSEYLDNWTKSNITSITHGATSPAGDASADTIITSGSGTHSISRSQTLSTTVTTYTFSVYIKTNSGTQPFQLRIDGAGGTVSPTTGTAASFTANTTWQRYSVTQTFTGSGATSFTPVITITNNTATIVAWGAMLHTGSTPAVYSPLFDTFNSIATGATARGGLSIAGDDGNVGHINLVGGAGQNSGSGGYLRFAATGTSNVIAEFRDCCNAVFSIGNTGNPVYAREGIKLTASTDITTGTNEDLGIVPNGTGNITLGTSDATGTLFFLDSKTGSGEGAGITGAGEGAMYYNLTDHKFRCYQNTGWTDCIGSGGGGVTGVGTLLTTPSYANGAGVSGSNLILQVANGSFAGLVDTSAQTFAGVKTFTSAATIGGATNATQLTVKVNASQTKNTPVIQVIDSGGTNELFRVSGPDAYSFYAGHQAGKDDLGAGGQNTGVGYYALRVNTSGFYNTAIGSNALTVNVGGAANTAIGVSALSSNVSGQSNTAVGVSALQNNTGDNNVALGYQSMMANVSGTGNVGLGRNTLLSSTSGTDNIALGNSAIWSGSGGSYNIALGTETLTAVTGDYNIGLGYHSLYNTTSGTNNLALGRNTLVSNVTGSQNIALGNSAMWNASGSDNIALGYESLANTTGNYNVGLGYHTLYNNTSGINNTALGNTAGQAVITGQYNTFIGDSAGYGDGTFNTLSGVLGSTAIGYNSQVLLDNSVVIGRSDATNIKVGIANPAPLNFFSASSYTGYAGTASVTSGTTTVTRNSGSAWTTNALIGMQIVFADGTNYIVSANNTTTITLATNASATETGANYRLYYQGLQVKNDGTIYTGGNLSVGYTAGSNTVLTVNGATVNTTLAVSNDADGGVLGGGLAASASVDTYSSISINQTTSGQAITLPTPTASTTYGRTITISNIGSVSFTLAGRYLAPSKSMTVIWSNTTGGASWQPIGGGRGTAQVTVAASNASTSVKEAAEYLADGEAVTGLGTVDGDQVQINNALTAVSAAGGGTVYLTEGTFTIDASISIPNNTSLIGAGQSSLIKLTNTAGGTLVGIVNTDTTTGTSVVIRDLAIDGQAPSVNTSGTQRAISFTNMGNYNAAGSRTGAKVTNININNVRSDGILLTNSDVTLISGITFNFTPAVGQAAVTLTTSEKNIISNNHFFGPVSASGTGIYLTNSTSINNTISNNVITEYSNGEGIYDLGTNTLITGNTVTGAGTAIRIGTGSDVITNNYVNGSTYGIRLTGGNNTVSGNYITSSSTGINVPSANNVISGNRLVNNGGTTDNDSIVITSGPNNISGNEITDSSCTTTCNAISITAGTNNFLDNNTFSGTAANPAVINDAGTRTRYGGQLTPASFLQSSSTLIKTYANSSITGTGGITVATTTTLTGTSTKFLTELQIGDRITVNSQTRTVTAIASDTSLTVDSNLTGGTWSGQTITRLPAALIVQNSSSTNVLTVSSVGAVQLRNSTDSSAAFTVQNAAGTSVLNVDTSTSATTFGGEAILSTVSGAGLASCSNATTSKLLYDSTAKTFSCGTDQSGGSSLFTDAGTQTYLNSTTDELVIGSTSSISSKLAVVGTSDQKQLTIRANATQTNPLIVAQVSGGTELFRLTAKENTSLFLGYNSGANISSGTNNIGLGYNTLNQTTTQTQNVAIGASSQQNSTGSQNTSVGDNALSGVLTGSYNTAIGRNVLTGNTSGGYNAGVGAGSLTSVNIGSSNSALGTDSLFNLQSGDANVAVGYQAGLGITTGSNNTFIGKDAGKADSLSFTQTNVSGSTALGAHSVILQSDSVSIGGSDDTNLKVGIGNPAPINFFSAGAYTGTNGTATVSSGSPTVTRVGGSTWTNSALVGQQIVFADGTTYRITANTTTTLTLHTNATAAETAAAYRTFYPGIQVTNSGNVGVGVLNPTGASLSVSSNTNQTQLLIAAAATQSIANPIIKVTNSSGTELFRITSNDVTNFYAGNGAGNVSSTVGGTGVFNTLVGSFAGSSLTTQGYNTAVGAYSLQAATSTDNTAIGSAALNKIATGNGNTALGSDAGKELVGASANNVLLGAGAGVGATGATGSNNVFVGSGVGYNITGADNNILVGYNVGSNLTTGDNNIIIGYNINPASGTGSNQLNIGNVLFGDTSVGSALFKNTTNSTTALQVQNASGYSVLTVDTTDTNLVTNPGAEVNTTGWAGKGTGTVARDTTQQMYGLASFKITGSAINDGAEFTFGSSLAPGTYSIGVSVKITGNAFPANTLVFGLTNTGGDNNCTSITPSVTTTVPTTTGWTRFQSLSCTFATTNATKFYVKQTDATSHSGANYYNIDGVEVDSGTTATPYAAGGVSFNANIKTPLTLQNQSDSTNAFTIYNSAGNSVLTADTLNGMVNVGKSDANATVLVLDTKNTSGNPTLCTNGGMYYNSNANEFRACKNGSWVALVAGVDVQNFTANGNYTRPAGTTLIMIVMCGGGGSGGGGRTGASTTARGGGTGGGGGARIERIFKADDIGVVGSTTAVVVGAATTGGAVNSNGTVGNPSYFGTGGLFAAAMGGGAGFAGQTSGNEVGGGGGGLITAGHAGGTTITAGGDNSATGGPGLGWAGGSGTSNGAGNTSQFGGSGGGATIGTGAAGTAGGASAAGGTGGGAGGGATAGNVGAAGGAGGANANGNTAGGTAGATTPTAGGTGTAGTSARCGTGGGGGGSPLSGAAGTGGAGGAGGSAGGGGGGGAGGVTGGVGGAGGRGEVWVYSW